MSDQTTPEPLEFDENTLPEEFENVVADEATDVELSKNQDPEADIDGNVENDDATDEESE